MFINTHSDPVWQHTAQHRKKIYNLVSTFSEADWNHETLCAGWRVRDVIGHMVLIFQYSSSDLAKGILQSNLSLNAYLKDSAIKVGDGNTVQLLKQFHGIVDAQKVPTIVPPMNALVDALVHEQDIRIPLNRPRNIELDSLRLVFQNWLPGRYNLGERITGVHKRTKGLQFVAEDIDMQFGTGLEVIGRAQDILLAMAGRQVILDKLHGEGMEMLAKRFQ